MEKKLFLDSILSTIIVKSKMQWWKIISLFSTKYSTNRLGLTKNKKYFIKDENWFCLRPINIQINRCHCNCFQNYVSLVLFYTWKGYFIIEKCFRLFESWNFHHEEYSPFLLKWKWNYTCYQYGLTFLKHIRQIHLCTSNCSYQESHLKTKMHLHFPCI